MTSALRGAVAAVAIACALGAPPASAQSGGDAVIQDCQDGHVDGSYSQADYKQAMRDLPTDLDEYTDCREQIRASQLRAAAASKPAGARKNGRSGAATGQGPTSPGGGAGAPAGGSGSGAGAGTASGAPAAGAPGASAVPAPVGGGAAPAGSAPAAGQGAATGATPADAAKATPGSTPGVGLTVAPGSPGAPIAPVATTLREASIAPGQVAVGLALLGLLIGTAAWLAPRLGRRRSG